MGVIVVTGIPGVGKTTVMKKAAEGMDIGFVTFGTIMIDNAKELIGQESGETKLEKDDVKVKEDIKESETNKEEVEEQKKIEEELKKLEEKKVLLQGQKVEEGDFILVKITSRTQQGKIFRVSSEEDAKKAGIYDEKKAKQGYNNNGVPTSDKAGMNHVADDDDLLGNKAGMNEVEDDDYPLEE